MSLSLRHKAVFGILLIEASLLLLLLWIGSNILVSAAARELMQRAQAAGQMLSANSRNAVLALDLADLNQQVADMLRQPGIAYVRIVDRTGRVLAEGGDPPALHRPFRPDSDYAGVDDGVFDSAAPIVVHGVTHGRIELGFSVDEIATAKRDTLIQGLFIGAVLLALSALLALLHGN